MSTTSYFLWRNKKNISTSLVEKTYLELCSTFSIKTAPLIRQLLGSTKSGPNNEILLNIYICVWH